MHFISPKSIKGLFLAAVMVLSIGISGYANIINDYVTPLSFDFQSYERGDGFGELTISFSDNVFELSDIDTMTNDIASKIKLDIKPAIKGRFKPIGTRQVVFEFQEKPRMATKYEATINADEIKSLEGKPVKIQINYRNLNGKRFIFQTSRPYGYFNSGGIRPGDRKSLQFNIPMKLDSVSNNLRISDKFGRVMAFNIHYDTYTNVQRNAKKQVVKTTVGFNSNSMNIKVHEEEKDGYYSVYLDKDIDPVEGNLGMQEDLNAKYETYHPFKFTEYTSSYHDNDGYRYFPDVTVMAHFNNPIKPSKDIKYYVKVEPKVEKLNIGFEGGTIQMSGNFLGGKSYRFTVTRDLEDEYGQKLSGSAGFDIEFEHFFSICAVPQGYLIMESYLPGILPFKVRNVDSIQFDYCTATSESDMLEFVNDSSSYFQDGANQKNKNINMKWKWDRFYNYRLDLNKLMNRKYGYLAYRIRPNMQVPPYSRSDCDHPYSYTGIVQFTDMAITVKKGPLNTMVLVRSLKDNQPVEGASIYEISNLSKILLGKTGNDGVLNIGRGYSDSAVSNIMAVKDGRYSFHYISTFSSWCDNRTSSQTEPNTVFWGDGSRYRRPEAIIFSDRKLYKPGETVDLKGVIRYRVNDDWSVKPGKEKYGFWVKISDSRNTELTNLEVEPDQNGGFRIRLQLDENCPTGYYPVMISMKPEVEDNRSYYYENQLYYDNIRVEDFKPARAEMRIIPDKNSYVWGEKLQADLIGWYLFGAPVGKPIDFSVSVKPVTFHSKNYPQFNFSDRGGYDYYYDYGDYGDYDYYYRGDSYSINLGSGNLKPDADGRAKMAMDLKNENYKGDAQISISAKTVLDDESTVFGMRSGIDLFKPVHIGLKTPGYFINSGDKAMFSLIALDGNEKVIPDTPVLFQIVRFTWNSYQKAGVNGRLSWEYKEIRQTVVSNYLKIGLTNIGIPSLEPGYYQCMALYGKGSGQSLAKSSFYAIGGGDIGWRMSQDNTVGVQKDKGDYQVGDTARVLVQNPFKKAVAFITLEREKIHEYFQMEATNSMLVIPVKITKKMIPNMYVTVTLIAGRSGTNQVTNDNDLARPKYLYGSINLKVIPKEKRLTILVTPERENYQPKDTVNAKIEVFDSDGKPADADLTVSVADKGVLNLVNYRLPDLTDYFYRSRPNAVHTTETRDFIYGQRYLSEKGEVVGGDGGLAQGMIVPRSDFRFTAFYRSRITTTNGTAKIQFVLPDNLSSFRMMASAHNQFSQFGYGDSVINVKKSIMILPTMPRFVRNFDRFHGGAMFFNYTGKSQKFQITATVDSDIELAGSTGGKLVTNVTIDNNASREVLFDFRSGKFGTGDAEYTFTAKAENSTDGIRETMKVLNPQIPEVTALYEKTTGKQDEILKVSDNVIRELSSLDMTLSPTAFSDLKGSVDSLIEYPYGCLEQKMSKILPLILGEDVILKYELLKNKTRKDIRDLVQQILNEIPNYVGNHGFRYWSSDNDNHSYLTIYACFVMTMAKKSGYSVNDRVFGQALDWVKEIAELRSSWDYNYYNWKYYREMVRNYALYVGALNQYVNVNALKLSYQSLNRELKDLTVAYAYCLKTVALYPDFSDRAKMKQEIEDYFFSRSRTEAQSIYFTGYDNWDWFYYNNNITTAIILQALIEAKSEFRESFKVVRYLLNARKAGQWETTHANAMVFWALNTYLNEFEKADPDFRAKVSMDNREVLTAMFKSRTAQPKTGSAVLPPDTEKVKVTFEKEGTGTLYYYLKYKYILKKYPEKRDAGFSVSKEVRDYDSNEPVKDNRYVRGKRYIVKIKVSSPKQRFFVVLDDQLPAGFEPVNMDFATEGNEKNVRTSGSDYWWYGFNHREFYRDRVVFFASTMGAHEYQLQYVVRAVTPGSFHVPLLKAEEMYAPEVFGTAYQPDITVDNPPAGDKKNSGKK